jgi:GNAT superfamily N-acetyltransferase
MPVNTPLISIRGFARSDLAHALAIQSQVYPVFLVESETSFSSRLDATMPYCLAATVKGQLAGYMLAHGWQRNAPPPLGTPLEEVGSAEILFIHDLAVATAGQGLGIGRRLVDHAFDLAVHDGLKSAELVAVEGAAGFWKTMGFVTLDATPEIAAKLAGYGRGATWMGRTIG